MKKKIMYVELKSGFNDNGPAWIGSVAYSKSGQTVYFNGKAFKKSAGISGNYHDLETREEYWISGVKKNQQDRHWAGSGRIMIDRECINEYLELVGKGTLDDRLFEIVSLVPSTPSSKFHEAENAPLSAGDPEGLKYRELYQLTNDELIKLIDLYSEEEKESSHNKGRRYIKQKRLAAERELEKREVTAGYNTRLDGDRE